MLTTEEVNIRMSEKNLILLDNYMGSHYKHNILCYCGNKFYTRLSHIFDNRTRSCGCYRTQLIINRCFIDLTGQRFGRLLVFSRCKNKNSKKIYWHCLCECGCLSIVSGENLTNNHTKSCGCYKIGRPQKKVNPLDNKKFGKLFVIKYSHTINQKVIYECICDCGSQYLATYYQLIDGVMPCCDNCKHALLKNGLFTSYKALELHNMIGCGKHNYFIDIGEKKKINVDIAIPEKMIAIEYDEWYWHKERLDKDKQQTSKLINNRWNIIRILAHRNLPTQEQIDKALVEVYNKNPYIIQLNGWGMD